MAEQDTNQSTEVLELTTIRQRQKIKIDDISYDLLGFDELELDSYLQVLPLLKKMQGLQGLDESELTAKQAKEIGEVVNRLSRLLLPDVPETTFKKLIPLQKMAIVNAVKEVSGTDFFDQMAAITKAKRQSRSRASKDSTVARRRTGKK